MADDKLLERLLETNERMVASSDKKFNILAVLYVLTLIGFFSYLSFGVDGRDIALSTNSTFESKIEQKVSE